MFCLLDDSLALCWFETRLCHATLELTTLNNNVLFCLSAKSA